MILLVELLLAGWFVRAALDKVRGRTDTAANFGNYRLIPARLAPVVVALVVTLEIVLAVMLAMGVAGSGGLLAVSVVLLVFGSVVAVDLLLGRHHPCGCGFLDQADISWRLVGRNLVVALAVAGIAWLAPPSPEIPWTTRLIVGMTISVAWTAFVVRREFVEMQRLTADPGERSA